MRGLTYFFQAAAFDASLPELSSRTNVLSANISTGNIGANVRNDIAWRSDWVAKLTETETLMNNMLRNTSPQRTIRYTTNIQERESARDYARETTELDIEAALHTFAVFPVSVQRTVQAVYDGLQTTGRTRQWELDGWPRQGVSGNNPFSSSWGGTISIAFEVLNDRSQVIGRQTVEMDSRYRFSGTSLEGPGTAFSAVRFTGVSAHAITDNLNIRIASINGKPPEDAGISQIQPISAGQMQAGKNFAIYNGAIRSASNSRELGTLAIPAELWGERVSSIAKEGFQRRGISSVTIPDSVIFIGDEAFSGNRLSDATIPNRDCVIGNRVFSNNNYFLEIDKGVVLGFSQSLPSDEIKKHSSLVIPAVHWSRPVTAIGNEAFRAKKLSSLTIPEGITRIGDRAFAENCWMETKYSSDGSSNTYVYGIGRVTLPNSVTSIGAGAFYSPWKSKLYDSVHNKWETIDHWQVTEVMIGANVSLGKNAIGVGFEEFYKESGKQAGIYGRNGTANTKWRKFDNFKSIEKDNKKRKAWLIVGILFGVAAVAVPLSILGSKGLLPSSSE
ncbi:MAG: leucine-rich repeat domain-containing protein [Treponema sp.]|nr:leucine-rich repeat domain-containing protein [Treponema sp.]